MAGFGSYQNPEIIQQQTLVTSIPVGQWSGSDGNYYITVTASNVTADSIIVPNYDKDSATALQGPIWCVPGAGSFTINTTKLPTDTVNIMTQFAGTMGVANHQVLADVYSRSQIDNKIANDLGTTVEGKILDARQGKVLNDSKANISDVYSKSQAVAKADIVNNLTNTATDKPGSANMLKTLNDIKPNKYLQSITNANDSTLFGTGLLQDTACSNLPTSNGNYYQVFFYGPFQIAIHFAANGTDALYARYYANNQWYPWALCCGQTTTNAITGAASGVTANGYYVYSPSTQTVRVYISADSTNNISTSTLLGVIPSGYRPSATVKLPGMIVTSAGVIAAYYGEINTSGNITQQLSASARQVFLSGEYSL